MDNGFTPGDKIAIIVPNCPEFGPVLFGSLGNFIYDFVSISLDSFLIGHKVVNAT